MGGLWRISEFIGLVPLPALRNVMALTPLVMFMDVQDAWGVGARVGGGGGGVGG